MVERIDESGISVSIPGFGDIVIELIDFILVVVLIVIHGCGDGWVLLEIVDDVFLGDGGTLDFLGHFVHGGGELVAGGVGREFVMDSGAGVVGCGYGYHG